LQADPEPSSEEGGTVAEDEALEARDTVEVGGDGSEGSKIKRG